MAFSKTIPQMRNRTKTVTRRVGTWKDLKPGTLLCAVEKSQGLAKGEKVKRIGVIRVLSVRVERLASMEASDVAKEGFPDMKMTDFRLVLGVPSWSTMVTRIEFEHMKDSDE